METDKRIYCSSSFLMYRTIADRNMSFSSSLIPTFFDAKGYQEENVYNASDLLTSLKDRVQNICSKKKTALALSGGIDSAILAKFMPEGSIAYTFKCIVPGIQVLDETPQAAKYAEECGLIHKIVEIYWEDFEKLTPVLMRHKNAPIHSIEVQIYKACLQALKDGNEAIIFGESSDLNYGGLSGLLSRDWTIGEFIDRYSYVRPYHALKQYCIVDEPIRRYEENGYVNVHEFNREFFFQEAMGSYTNACSTAGIELCTPYAHTKLAIPLDMNRIRSGENKYIVREVFSKLYPDYTAPEKTPMPRPMNEWFKHWKGPTRSEFWPNCTINMDGDQRYYIWILECFLNMLDALEPGICC